MVDDTKPLRAPKVTREQLATNRANGVKRCFGCDQTKPFSEFHKDGSRSDGLQPRCKACMAIKVAELNARKIGRRKVAAETFDKPKTCVRCAVEYPAEQFREYKIPKLHRSETCLACEEIEWRKWLALDNERKLQWRRDHPDWVRNYDREWQKANPEKCKAKSRKYRLNHLDECRRRDREYKRTPRHRAKERALYAVDPQKHRDKYKLYRLTSPLAVEKEKARCANRRALKMEAEGFHIAEDIIEIRKRQKDRCAHPWCRKKLRGKGHKDHRIPLTKGGTNWPWNIQLLCNFCNISKHNRSPEDYARKNGYLV